MAITKLSAFTFLHSSQIDALYTVYTATQIKTFFDSQASELKAYLNDVLTEEIDSNLATKTELAEAVLSGISDNSITNVKLVDKTIETGKIADDTITLLNLATTLKPLQYFGKYSQMSGGDLKTGSAQNGVIVFTTEDKDDFSAINLGTSTSKITIPSGVTIARLYCTLKVYTHNLYGATISLRKNGVSIQTLLQAKYYSGDFALVSYTTPITCIAGDYFEIYASLGTYESSNAKLYGGTIFGMEALG